MSTTFAQPDDDALATCEVCGGEGYYYPPNEGRSAQHPIHEIPCSRCGGTGRRAGP